MRLNSSCSCWRRSCIPRSSSSNRSEDGAENCANTSVAGKRMQSRQTITLMTELEQRTARRAQVRPDNNPGLERRNPECDAALVNRRWTETSLPQESDHQGWLRWCKRQLAEPV